MIRSAMENLTEFILADSGSENSCSQSESVEGYTRTPQDARGGTV